MSLDGVVIVARLSLCVICVAVVVVLLWCVVCVAVVVVLDGGSVWVIASLVFQPVNVSASTECDSS